MRLVLFSGGIDSTTALFWSKQETSTEALIFQYPSRHNIQECKRAIQICQATQVRYHILHLESIFRSFKSSLLVGSSEDIPQSQYDEKSLEKLVVPFRNGIFLSVAAGLAESLGADSLVLANHSGDHPIYPDCTREFIMAMNEAIWCGSGHKIRILSPFCDWDKNKIVQLGISLGVDYSMTYSCYTGNEKHCNMCPTCLESLEAFRANCLKIER
ncbi:7-cyano-7-deazaguanine synthase QueC [Helicobacter monodelphidis]|uniref:7-cyano-7-deazaguanine synthase QueC n=1 Tax=Helicobacter sp. 15-1451 TaxID=2004995 RepID=UPI000DCBBAEA|nr:7-cyano-7-deazaguanine synthase QueC [Helicobacter sp. 15-1451]RAX56939.1 7-cyano-7-deazaguanine synthase QueC [Helicobacter sp. 15-1451]